MTPPPPRGGGGGGHDIWWGDYEGEGEVRASNPVCRFCAQMGMPAVRRVSNLQKSELEKCLNNTKKMQEQLDALKAKEREEQQQVNAKIAELTAERWRLQAQINDTKKTAADKVKVLEKEKEVLQQESKVKLAEVALKGNALAVCITSLCLPPCLSNHRLGFAGCCDAAS